jgi:hypothetical protein
MAYEIIYINQDDKQIIFGVIMTKGLYHTFHLVSRDDSHYDEYWYGHKLEGGIYIHDDYLSTLADAITWIPTYNPATKEEWQGLCWTGATVIRGEGSQVARKIFAAWAVLINNGPKHPKLRGNYALRSTDSGYFTQVEVNREEFVSQLSSLAAYAGQVVQSNDHQFILHMGL